MQSINKVIGVVVGGVILIFLLLVWIGSTDGGGDTGESILDLEVGEAHPFQVVTPRGTSELHFVVLKAIDIDAETATFVFRSEPVEKTVAQDSPAEVDITGNGESDINVELAEFQRERAKVRIESRYRGTEYLKNFIENLHNDGKNCEEELVGKDDLGRPQFWDVDEATWDKKSKGKVRTLGHDGEPVYEADVEGAGRQRRLKIYHKDGSATEYLDTEGDIYKDKVVRVDADGNKTVRDLGENKVQVDMDFASGELTIRDKYIDPSSKDYKDSEGNPISKNAKGLPGRIRRYDADGNLREESGFDENGRWQGPKYFDKEGNPTDEEWDPALEAGVVESKAGIEIVFEDMVDILDSDGDGFVDADTTFNLGVFCDSSIGRVMVDEGLGELSAVGPVSIGVPPGGDEVAIYGSSGGVYNGLLWKPPEGYTSGEVEAFDFPSSDGRSGFSGNIQMDYSEGGQNFGRNVPVPDSRGYVTVPFSAPATLQGAHMLFGEGGTAYRAIRLHGGR